MVLGERGRAYVWSGQGKLVTSLNTTPESIERKKETDLWRPASPPKAPRLRRRRAGAYGSTLPAETVDGEGALSPAALAVWSHRRPQAAGSPSGGAALLTTDLGRPG